MTELKKCPFCGCEVHIEKICYVDIEESHIVGEHDDDCILRGRRIWGLMEHRIVAMWNTRA